MEPQRRDNNSRFREGVSELVSGLEQGLDGAPAHYFKILIGLGGAIAAVLYHQYALGVTGQWR